MGRWGDGEMGASENCNGQDAHSTHRLKLIPIPDSRFPIPDSRFPIPDSQF